MNQRMTPAVVLYHFRIAFIFIDVSTAAMIIALVKTTDSIKVIAKQVLSAAVPEN